MSAGTTNGATSTAAGPAKGRAGAFRVEVTARASFNDAAGEALAGQLPLIGVAGASQVRVGALYELAGRLSYAQAVQAASHALADPITQQYEVMAMGVPAPRPPHATPRGETRWRIEVWLKASVSDPAEASVRKALSDLGLPAPDTVRCGAVYQIAGRVNFSQAERIAVKLLANPVIHRYAVTRA